MKSIRRAMLINVTLLVAVVLAGLGVWTYRTISATLEDKSQATRVLIRFQFDERRDEALLTQARNIAREMQSQFDPEPIRYQAILAAIGHLSAPTAPYAHVSLPVWSSQSVRGPVSSRIYTAVATRLQLNEDDLTRTEDSSHDYIQLNTTGGAIWRSKALGKQSLPIPNENPDLYRARYDDIMQDNVPMRRIAFKVPLTRFSRATPQAAPPSPPIPSRLNGPIGVSMGGLISVALPRVNPPTRPDLDRDRERFSGMRGGPGNIGRRPPPNSNPIPFGFTLPVVEIQCAWPLDRQHPILEPLERQRDERIAEVDRLAGQTLENLRWRFACLSLLALGLTVLGGVRIVGHGLRPFGKLSEAVRAVSSRDFRLAIAPDEMPREIRPVAERMRETLADLEAAFAREKRAAADISHELRTPLASLTTTLEVALRKPRTAELYRGTIEDCRQIAKQMSLLVERMLELAWLDAGGDALRPEAFPVHELAEGISAVVKPLAEAHGLSFRTNVPEALSLCTDPAKLREVLINLVHNAIEYNRPGGSVELVAFSRAEGGIAFEVVDTGIGIPAEMRTKIFERFFRADPSRHATGAHAGLGLAIVKEYVDRLGGTLAVESEPGEGSRFRVEVPDAPCPIASAPMPVRRGEALTSSAIVLR